MGSQCSCCAAFSCQPRYCPAVASSWCSWWRTSFSIVNEPASLPLPPLRICAICCCWFYRLVCWLPSVLSTICWCQAGVGRTRLSLRFARGISRTGFALSFLEVGDLLLSGLDFFWRESYRSLDGVLFYSTLLPWIYPFPVCFVPCLLRFKSSGNCDNRFIFGLFY